MLNLEIPESLLLPGVAEILRSWSPERIAEHLNKVKPLETRRAEIALPVTVGQLGEARVEEILRGHYFVENVTKSTAMCDLLISRQGEALSAATILVEVKNKSVSSKKDFLKFLRDLVYNNQTEAALMITLSDSTSFRAEKYYLGRGILVIYLSTNNPDIILTAIQMLWTYVDAGLEWRTKEDLEKVYRKITEIAEQVNYMGQVRRQLCEHKALMLDSLDKLHERFLSLEIGLGDKVRELQKFSQKKAGIEVEKKEMDLNDWDSLNYVRSHFYRNKTMVLSLVKKFVGEEVEIEEGKKILILGNGRKVQINPLITKTVIRLWDKEAQIPRWMNYIDGWLEVEVNSENYSKIEEWITQQPSGNEFLETVKE